LRLARHTLQSVRQRLQHARWHKQRARFRLRFAGCSQYFALQQRLKAPAGAGFEIMTKL